MNRHEIEIEDLSQGGRRGANLTLGTVHFLWDRVGWWDLGECHLEIA